MLLHILATLGIIFLLIVLADIAVFVPLYLRFREEERDGDFR